MHLLDLKKAGATDAILENAEVLLVGCFLLWALLFIKHSDYVHFISADKFAAWF